MDQHPVQQPLAEAEAQAAPLDKRDVKGRSFWQAAWQRFSRHPMARLGGAVLLVLYLTAIFADFLSPYPPQLSFRQHQYMPPTPIHWRSEDGRLARPYVCPVSRERDPRTFRLVFTEDCSETYPIYFFVRSYEYKLFGFIPTNVRLMGGEWLQEQRAHLFIWGTDGFGRDMFTRIWHGGRITLTVGIFATLLALLLGAIMGGISGLYAGRPVSLMRGVLHPSFQAHWQELRGRGSRVRFVLAWLFRLALWIGLIIVFAITTRGFWQGTEGLERWLGTAIGVLIMGWFVFSFFFQHVRLDLDTLIMRTTEVLFAIPGLFLLITLRVVFPMEMDPTLTFYMVITILAFIGWGGLARDVRSLVLRLREQEFVHAAHALGASTTRTLLLHILPGTFGHLIVIATLLIPAFILAESGLSFLGLGIQEPASSWGLLLSRIREIGILAVRERPWLLLPGFFIFVAIMAYNFLGDGLRDAFDPRSTQR
jgi:peptide/nickel transport system permease protein